MTSVQGGSQYNITYNEQHPLRDQCISEYPPVLRWIAAEYPEVFRSLAATGTLYLFKNNILYNSAILIPTDTRDQMRAQVLRRWLTHGDIVKVYTALGSKAYVDVMPTPRGNNPVIMTGRWMGDGMEGKAISITRVYQDRYWQLWAPTLPTKLSIIEPAPIPCDTFTGRLTNVIL